MIECKFINKRYTTGQTALSRVSFKINTGEMVFLTGHSGAGKSTLLKLINHIEKPSAGRLIVNNLSVSDMKPKQIPCLRRDIGMIFQNPKLIKTLNLFDNIALPLRAIGFPRQEIPKRVRAALDKVDLLKKEACFPEMLSSGEQQCVEIARAVVHRPKLILADEPTGNLDPSLSQEILSLFSAFNEVGATVLVATHDLSLIARLHHRVLVLKQGKLSGAL